MKLAKLSLTFFFILFALSLIYFYFFQPSVSSTLVSPLNINKPISIPTISVTPTPPLTITLGLVGDLGLGRHITSIARSKQDFSWSFSGVASWLQQNDFNLANLESPIITNCPEGKTGTFTFCGDAKFLPYLFQNKFVFNLNNNHILNYGQSGLDQTKNFLTTDYFYDKLYTKTVNNISFGFLGYDFVTYPNTDPQQVITDIKKSKPGLDWLIISIHWGNEYLPKPESWRIAFAHQMIDAGADIIHGHHPHVWQPPEIYRGKPIFYSFGNFIFDQSWSKETSHSQIARLTLTKTSIASLDYFPITIKFNSQPSLSP